MNIKQKQTKNIFVASSNIFVAKMNTKVAFKNDMFITFTKYQEEYLAGFRIMSVSKFECR